MSGIDERCVIQRSRTRGGSGSSGHVGKTADVSQPVILHRAQRQTCSEGDLQSASAAETQSKGEEERPSAIVRFETGVTSRLVSGWRGYALAIKMDRAVCEIKHEHKRKIHDQWKKGRATRKRRTMIPGRIQLWWLTR